MDYKHTQHAGNGGDVLKHFMLAALLSEYALIPDRLWYLETHAGAGLYDLPQEPVRAAFRIPASKVPAANIPAWERAHSKKAEDTSYYPGSPVIADTLLRPQDRMTLFEASGADFGRLGEIVVRENLGIHYGNGFWGVPEALRSPDAEDDDCHAVVFIDPDYSQDQDWEHVLGTVAEISVARPGSTIIVWHPIFDQNPGLRRFDIAHFQGTLRNLALDQANSFLWQEVITTRSGESLRGAAMCIMNAWPGIGGPLTRAILSGRSVYRTTVGNLHWGG